MADPRLAEIVPPPDPGPPSAGDLPMVRPKLLLSSLALLLGSGAPLLAQCGGETLLSPLGPGSEFGVAVDVDGDDLLVGAPGADQALFYRRTGGAWVPAGAPVTLGAGTRSGRSVAVANGLAIVGAPDADVGGVVGAGRIQVFTSTVPGVWTAGATYSSPSPVANAEFGFAVDTDGATVIVGEPGTPNGGRAFVFDVGAGGALTLKQHLLGSNLTPASRYGAAVAIEGIAAVVGAPEADLGPNASNNGGAFPFRRTPGGNWSGYGWFSTTANGGRIGSTVAISGPHVIAGSPGKGLGIFLEFDGFQYVHDGIAFLVSLYNGGYAVALEGNRAVITSPAWDGHNLLNVGDGAFRVYDHDGADFHATTGHAWAIHDDASNVGLSAAISGNLVVLGGEHWGGTLTDAVYTFDLTQTAWQHVIHSYDWIHGTGNKAVTMNLQGSFCAGEEYAFYVDAPVGNTPTFVVVGSSYLGAPMLGGTFGPTPDLLVTLPTNAIGFFDFSANLPPVIPAGVDLYLQAWSQDPGGPQGWAASHTYRRTTAF